MRPSTLRDSWCMPVRLRLAGLQAACVCFALSCTGASEPGSLVEGDWAGAITGDAQDGTLRWTLRDAAGEVSGEGSLSTATASVPLTIEGTYDPPTLSLVMHPEGFEDILFTGTVSQRSIKGRMTGAGLFNRTITLDRGP